MLVAQERTVYSGRAAARPSGPGCYHFPGCPARYWQEDPLKVLKTMSDSSRKPPEANPTATVPKVVVSRLSLYLRELQQLVRDGQETTNSTQLGELIGVTAAQVRKDLAYFGQFGYPGIGYPIDGGNSHGIEVGNPDFGMSVCLFVPHPWRRF